MKRSLLVLPLIVLGVFVATRVTPGVRSAGSTATPVATAPGTGTPTRDVRLTVLPETVARGDVITVVAAGLPGPADQFCVYEGLYPLAHFLPPGYGEQAAPLLRDGSRGQGIGAYQTMEGISGHVILSVASCRHGLAPKSLTAVATKKLDLSDTGAAGMPFGLRIIGRTPLGTPFTLTPLKQDTPSCLFIVPDVVLPGLRPIPGVRVPADAGSATLKVPASYPWGVYQIFQTRASPKRACPATQLRGDAVLMSAPWTFGRWRLRMESEGQPSAGSGLALRLDNLYAPAPVPVCVTAWMSGRYAGISRTYPETVVGAGGPVRFPLPRSLVGSLTVTGTMSACPAGPPGRFDAFTLAVISGPVGPSPTPTPRAVPAGSAVPVSLAACPLLPAAGPLSPRGKDARLNHSTYLGQGAVQGTAVALDSQGNAHVALTGSGAGVGCIVELSRDGSHVLRSEMIPASIEAMALDRSGNLWLTGNTASRQFPLVRSILPARSGNPAFVAELDPAGRLIFSTELGGTMGAEGQAIAVDNQGSVYITGQTDSTDFPTTKGALQLRSGSIVPCPSAPCPGTTSSSDAFITKISAKGKLIYSTYLGRNENEDGQGIAVDADGNAYVSGWTASNDFPAVHHLPRTQCAGPFLVKVGPNGDRLLASTCLGVRNTGGLSGPVALAGAEVVLGGYGGVMRVDLRHGRIAWQLHLSKSSSGVGSLATDGKGTVYLTGSTADPALPMVHPIQRSLHRATCEREDSTHYCTDAFVAAVSSSGKLLFSTYLGGKADDAGQGISVQGGRIAVTGFTASEDFPMRLALQSENQGVGGTDQYYGGKLDGFVTVLSP